MPAKTATTPDQDLNQRELDAWRGLLRSHALLLRVLDAELEEHHGIGATTYEVLLHLANSDCGSMRMRDLADSVLLSRSGLTRLVDRLERDGYIERMSCSDDARGLNAVLTAKGRAKLHEAGPTHIAGIREHFLEPLDGNDLEVLAAAWERVLAGLPSSAHGLAPPSCSPKA